MFARWGWDNGKTESFAYTEIDSTFVGGAGLNGAQWHRRHDRAGIAFVSNGMTTDVPGTGAKITFMCGMSSQRVVVEPVLHGAPPVAVQNSLVRFPDLSATLQFVYPTSIESVTVKLTPINPTGCP